LTDKPNKRVRLRNKIIFNAQGDIFLVLQVSEAPVDRAYDIRNFFVYFVTPSCSLCSKIQEHDNEPRRPKQHYEQKDDFKLNFSVPVQAQPVSSTDSSLRPEDFLFKIRTPPKPHSTRFQLIW